jgi:hypothetical protein
MYNPSGSLAFGSSVFATANPQEFTAFTGNTPSGLATTMAAYQQFGIDTSIDEVDKLTLIGALSTNPAPTAGTLAIQGNFDTNAVISRIKNESEANLFDTETNGDYTVISAAFSNSRYTVDDYTFGVENSEHTTSFAAAISGSTIIVSYATHESVSAVDTIGEMIDTEAEGDTPYQTDSEAGRLLLDALQDTTVSTGGEFFAASLKSTTENADVTITGLDSLIGMGMGTTLADETTETILVLAYESADSASEASAREILEYSITGQKNADDWDAGETEVTVDGQVVTVTLSPQSDALRRLYATILWNQESADPPITTGIPTVFFEFEQNTDNTYTIRHQGGDDFNAKNITIQYTNASGTDINQQWGGDERVTGRDSTRTQDPVQPGSTIRITWEDLDGEKTTQIQTHTVPE